MKLSGSIVFASGKAGDYDVWSLALSDGHLLQLTHGTSCNDQPKWSPDGREVAFISDRSGVPEIWCVSADGDNLRQVTSKGRAHFGPCWTQDGRQIVCGANYGKPDEIEIWAVNADGSGEPELLVHVPGMETDPCISPDGKRVIFSCMKSGNYDVWEYRLDTKTWKQLTRHPGRDHSPVYSPDGKLIAFVSKAALNEDSELWIMNGDGTGLRQVTSNSASDDYVAWSPDGRALVYCSSASPGTGRLQILDLVHHKVLKDFVDRSELEAEIGATVKDFGPFTKLFPDKIQKLFVARSYFGSERHPHWKS